MVVKVSMNCHKCRSKALKIAVGFEGVESVSLKGDDKSQIEVTGDRVDAVKLTRLLRKKMKNAELVSVSATDDEKKNEPNPTFYYVPPPYSYQGIPSYGYVEQPGPFCSIM